MPSNLSFAPNRFDLMISQNVFHHIPNWPQAVEEIVRVLRPGGQLFWLDLAFLSRLHQKDFPAFC